MSDQKLEKKVIVFCCNWQGFRTLERIGADRRTYSSMVYPLRLACLGRITPGIILKTFEKGAAGVYLAGCPESECRHQTGNQAAYQVFQESRALMKLLGYREEQLQFAFLGPDDGERFLMDLEIILTAGEPA